MPSRGVGKYKVSDRCDWCGRQPAKEIKIQANGTKLKRYWITASACSSCARRVTDDRE
jgi:hypothetical protein